MHVEDPEENHSLLVFFEDRSVRLPLAGLNNKVDQGRATIFIKLYAMFSVCVLYGR